MQLTRLAWLGSLLGLALGEPLGYYGYGYGSVTAVTGTDPASSVPTSAPYGNSTSFDPTGTAPYPTGTAVPTGDPSGTAPYSTGDPSGTAPYSTGDPSGTAPYSTGDPSGTGGYTYTAPTGIPAEYYYHHKKPKRNSFYRRWGLSF